MSPIKSTPLEVVETCDVCGRESATKLVTTGGVTKAYKPHPCRFEVACSCWRGVPCDGSGRIGRRQARA